MSNNIRSFIQTSKSFKLIIIAALSLLLLIPAMMIQDTIRERENTRSTVISEVSQKWGNAQSIAGPFINIPFEVQLGEGDKQTTITKVATFLPEELFIDGVVSPNKLKRSLYEVILYEGAFEIDANFNALDFSKWNANPDLILWDKASISLGLTDLRGISDKIEFSLNTKKLEVEPGISENTIMRSGISVKTKLGADTNYRVRIKLNLNGSDRLYFIPLGKSTKVGISSTWPSPGFEGAFLPKKRDVNDDGFESNWHVLHLNRNYPQQWLDNQFYVDDSAFGVRLIEPVDQYQKAFRSVKYAFMFISLTFMIFFFAEIKNKLKIHPIQYLLVGLALVVFYTLLISLSEHISLNLAFLVSSLSIIGLISLYAASIFKKKAFVASVALSLSALYTFLFTILQLEDYSLLMGSIGLFVIIALLMFAARKVEWYGDNETVEEGA